MKLLKINSLLFLFLTFSSIALAQEGELLTSVPKKKADFKKSETAVINTINWLENTPVDGEDRKRKALSANLATWITDSPTVTVSLDGYILPFTTENKELLVAYMGGWTKYSLENNYSEDEVKCSLAGIQSCIKVYQNGKTLKKDKEFEKLIELNAKNELEAWIKEQVKK